MQTQPENGTSVPQEETQATTAQNDIPDNGTEQSVDENQLPSLNANVTMRFDMIEPRKNVPGVPLNMLGFTYSQYLEKAQRHPEIRPDEEGNISTQYAYSVMSALPYLHGRGEFEEAFTRPGSDWQQEEEFEGRRLAMARPTIRHPGAGSTEMVTGKQAVQRIQSRLGIGSPIVIPCWHSGFWMELKTPSDAALLNLDQAIADWKMTLGRQTGGLIFSNLSVYIKDKLVAFIVDHATFVGVKGWTAQDPMSLTRYLREPDLNVIAAYLAGAMYPNGHPLDQPCIHNPAKCQHVESAHLNLAKIFWIDRARVTAEMRRHMNDQYGVHSPEAIKKYQEMAGMSDGETVNLDDDMKIVFRVPTVQETLEAGWEWINEIQAIVDKALRGSNTADRDKFLLQHAMLALLRQHRHWIKSIVYEDVFMIDSDEDMNRVLESLSTREDVAEAMQNALRKFMDHVALHIVAIRSYSCRVCRKPQTPEESAHPSLIPIDAVLLFFTLKDRRVSRVATI